MSNLIRVEDFKRELCNDHNGKIRWLRGVAVSNDHLLDQILELAVIDPAKIVEKLKEKYIKGLNKTYKRGLIYIAKCEALNDFRKELEGK